MMIFFHKTIAALMFFGFFTAKINGQINDSISNNTNFTGKKVGVVLSGGGAKGVAHVGVLRMIEEAGVKVDYIGGTSMGAIVAGLYAIGYSVDELDSIIRVLDMSKMVQGSVPRKNQTFFKKKFDSKTFAKLPVIDWVIGLPQGLSNGQDIIDEFNSLTRGFHGQQDFNKFPVPLVIMTTDIVTGESIEFHKGSLPLIMRASSSFPSLFAPVEIEGRLLVDGGVANNFPVQEVINMGADIIIGVSVEDGLYKRKDLTSINAIIEQITSFKMVAKSEKQKTLVDIFIKPDISNYSVVSFDKTPELIELGEVEGFKHFNEFLNVAKMQKNKGFIKKDFDIPTNYNISSVEVNGSKNYSDNYFIERFPVKKLPGVITINQIRNGLKTINGTENFDFISYELVRNGETYKMIIDVKEKPVNEFLKIGIHYDKLYGTGALINLTIRNRILKGSTFMAEVVISEAPRINVLLFKDNANWPGFLIQSTFMQYDVPVPTSILEKEGEMAFQGSVIDVNSNDWTTSFMAQKTINEDFFIALGIEFKKINFNSKSIKSEKPDGTITDEPYVFDDSWFFDPKVQIYADTKDDKDFPTRGLIFDAEYKLVTPIDVKSDSPDVTHNPTSFLDAKIDYSLPVGDKLSWRNIAKFSTRIGNTNSPGFSYVFGGYNKNLYNNVHSFFGYPSFNIFTEDDSGFFMYHTSIQYNFIPKWYLTAHANYLNLSSDAEYWYGFNRLDFSGYAVSLGFDSQLGPIEFTTDYSPETGQINVQFNLGYWF